MYLIEIIYTHNYIWKNFLIAYIKTHINIFVLFDRYQTDKVSALSALVSALSKKKHSLHLGTVTSKQGNIFLFYKFEDNFVPKKTSEDKELKKPHTKVSTKIDKTIENNIKKKY